jgi:hypothetical protein
MIKKIKKNKSIKNSKKISKEVIEISISKDLSINPGLKKKDNKNLDLNKEKLLKKNNSKNKNSKLPISAKKNTKKLTVNSPKKLPNKKIIKINLKKNQDKIRKKNSQKIINFIDWSKINPIQKSDLNIDKNQEQFNFLPPNNSSNLLQKLKEQKISNLNLQDCPLNYARKRIAKYIVNRRAQNSYNHHHQSLSKKIKNESLVRNHDDQNTTKH